MSSSIAQHPMIQLFRVTLPQLLFLSLPNRRGRTTTTALGLSSVIVLTLAAFTGAARPTILAVPTESSSFLGELHGDLHASPHGTARFGAVEGRAGATMFTLSLGADGPDGSVLFTRTNGGRLTPGTYAVSGRDDGSDEIRALVMTGPATRPTGVFRGQSGHLTITSATHNVIRGRFRVQATGFLASDPADESRPMKATGTFTATRE
jgi:hypothetical protein